MKIEDQVTSIEPSKELKELGAKQDSVSAWYQYVNGKPYIALKALQNHQDAIATYHDGYAECPKEICDAPTVAELGEMLPQAIDKHSLCIYKRDDQHWFIHYSNDYHRSERFHTTAKTEADARAKMLIHLIKEGIIKVKDIK